MLPQTEKQIILKPGRVWLSWRRALWMAGWLISFLVLGFLLLVQPETRVEVSPAEGNSHLSGLNSFVGIQRSGFGPVDSSNQSQPVSPGATVRLNLFSYRPLLLQLELKEGRGPLQISANGQTIGTIEGSRLAGHYEFNFSPRRTADDKPELNLRFDAPETFQLANLSLDLSQQWEPERNPAADELLLAIAAALLALLVSGGLANRARWEWLSWVTLIVAAVAGVLVVARGVRLIEVGPGGEMNAIVYWGGLGSSLYLLLFALAFGVEAVPVRAGKSIAGLGWRYLPDFSQRYPFAIAITTLTLFNALITVLFFGVVALQNYGFEVLARFWDGPEYLVVAHSLYAPSDPLLKIPALASKSAIYWTAHFPLYPFAVRFFSEIAGYVPSLFVVNFLFGTGFAVVVYRFLKDFGYSHHPLWVAALALFLPLRWLIYHTTGASEAATLFFLMLCLYQFKRGNYGWAGVWGAAVVLTRPNGIFLYMGLVAYIAWEAFERSRKLPYLSGQNLLRRLVVNFEWRALLYLTPLPLALLAVFGLFGWRYGDFLAYLHIPEDVKHLYPFPLLSMDVSVGRSEGNFYNYLLEAAGLVLLWRERRFDLFWVGLAFTLPTVFLLHDDILRYSLPAFPLVLLIPFARVLESKPARWLAPLALLGVLIYSWSQLSLNLVDQDTWRQMLQILNNS